VSNVTLGGTASFIGILDAPEANVTVNGGGNAVIDFSGTLLANSLTANGHLRMHYDESVGPVGFTEPTSTLPPPPPMTLQSLGFTTNGQFRFIGVFTPGYNWVVETSTDLMNWTPIFTFTNTGVLSYSNETIPVMFTDTNAINPGQCFYRTVYVQ
jgi:hypothetical protein